MIRRPPRSTLFPTRRSSDLVQVIGVSTDDLEDRAKVLQFVRETKVNFPIWVGGSIEHMMQFGLGGALPGTVVIDREGNIFKSISGVIDQAMLRKEIESLLAASDKRGALAAKL